MAVPLTAKVTVKSLVVEPVRDTVNAPVSVPGSDAAASEADMVTIRVSSSAMTTVALAGKPRLYPVPGESVTVTSSLPSTAVSSIGVTVIVAVAEPAAMVTLVPMDT